MRLHAVSIISQIFTSIIFDKEIAQLTLVSSELVIVILVYHIRIEGRSKRNLNCATLQGVPFILRIIEVLHLTDCVCILAFTAVDCREVTLSPPEEFSAELSLRGSSRRSIILLSLDRPIPKSTNLTLRVSGHLPELYPMLVLHLYHVGGIYFPILIYPERVTKENTVKIPPIGILRIQIHRVLHLEVDLSVLY